MRVWFARLMLYTHMRVWKLIIREFVYASKNLVKRSRKIMIAHSDVETLARSLVPRPFPVFSMLHAEKREGLVDFVM